MLIPSERAKVLKQFRARRNQSTLKLQSRRKVISNQSKPALTPAERRKIQAEESDSDILVVTTETVDFDSPVKSKERGKLLRLSTKKPVTAKPQVLRKPDPVPANSADTTKRIVRVVHRPPSSSTLDVSIVPKTRSIGVQVGAPAPELSIRPIVVQAPEPPLRSYWTHRINLPYPPQAVQPTVSGQYFQPQQQQQQVLVPHFQYSEQALPYIQPQAGRAAFHQLSGQPTRRQRRNFLKHQKYLQRRQFQ